MARGWESKSVEAQQAAADDSVQSSRLRLSKEEAAKRRAVENLRLARQRLLQQLEASSNPRYRKVLEGALLDLDRKIGQS